MHSPRHTFLVRGQSLIELLIALSIIIVSILGIFTLLSRSLGLNRINSEEYIASYLASEGIELVRNLFDHSFFLAPKGARDFYGWLGPGNIAPANGVFGVYRMDYNDTTLTPLSATCANFFTTNTPTEGRVRQALASPSCGAVLNFDPATGLYNYDSGSSSKFRRIIIIDYPYGGDASIPKLDYRITSAVGWESRGGKFSVQLQMHLLPSAFPL